MYEITFLVFIRYRGPFGLSVPLPRLRTAHVNKPLRVFHRFSLEDAFAPRSKGRRLGFHNSLLPEASHSYSGMP